MTNLSDRVETAVNKIENSSDIAVQFSDISNTVAFSTPNGLVKPLGLLQQTADETITRLRGFKLAEFVPSNIYTERNFYFIDDGIAYTPITLPFTASSDISIDIMSGNFTVLQGFTHHDLATIEEARDAEVGKIMDAKTMNQLMEEKVLGQKLVQGWAVGAPIMHYSGVSFSIADQDVATRALEFKLDGTKMYTLGYFTNEVYEFNISRPWDLSTATYSGASFFTGQQSAQTTGVTFKFDGTKMYVVGAASNSVHEYNLSTPWYISTATYSGASFSIAAQESSPQDVTFKSDGTKMYIVGNASDSVHEYNLSTPWDISTATHSGASFSVAEQELSPQDVTFKSDGTKMYVVGAVSDSVHEYNLSTPWYISTATYSGASFSVAGQESQPSGFTFKSDGTKMFVTGDVSDSVHEYSSNFLISI